MDFQNNISEKAHPAENSTSIDVVCTSAGAVPVFKKCSKCGLEKDISLFKKWSRRCKECRIQYHVEYLKTHKEERKIKRHKKYWENHKEVRLKNKEWRDSRKEIINKQNKDYYAANAERKRLLAKERRLTDIQFRIKGNLRSRLSLLVSGKQKSASTMELVGCTIEFLKEHLEKQFSKEMTWDNYGKNKFWSIDHIIACVLFDLTKPEEQRKCFNWSNLRPLSITENSSKGAKIQYIKSPKQNASQ